MKSSVKFEHFTKDAIPYAGFSSCESLLARESRESPYKGYIPLSPVKSDLRKTRGEEQLLIQGRLLDKTGSWPVGNAGIELWHLTKGSLEFKHRAKLISDPSGVFHFITDMPARPMGHNFKIYFKITVGQNTFFTRFSFNHCKAFLANRAYHLANGHLLSGNPQSGFSALSIFPLEIRINR